MLAAANALIDPGSREDFESFYKKHLKLVYAAAFSVLHSEQLAEDAAMEAFICIAAGFERIRALDEAGVRRYVYLISRSRALDLLRKENKDIAASELCGETALDDDALSRFEAVHIKDCISRLSADDRRLLYMSVSLGLDAKEIAGLSGCSPEAVRKRLQRARARLRKLIQEGQL